MAALVLLIGVLGAVVGSFLNVVIYRVPRGESVVRPGSRCPSCATPIGARDNVPVVSWLVRRGRCRACDAPISARYPLVEVSTALVFAAVAATRGIDSGLLLELPLAAVLIACSAIDLEHRRIPNAIVGPAAVWAIVVAALVDTSGLPERLGSGAGAFLLLLAAALAYPGGMGMGDVKLAGTLGLYLGVSIAPALGAAFLSGSVVGGAIMVRRGAQARKTAIPFGPFLALGGLVGVLAGPDLVDLYVDRFL